MPDEFMKSPEFQALGDKPLTPPAQQAQGDADDIPF